MRYLMIAVFITLMTIVSSANGMTVEMCEEVKVELDYAVSEGWLDAESAKAIAGRCFSNLEEDTK